MPQTKLTIDAITDKVAEIIADILMIDKDQVLFESLIIEDLGADSLDTVEIIMGVEEDFEFTIPDEDAESLDTVKKLVEYIDERING